MTDFDSQNLRGSNCSIILTNVVIALKSVYLIWGNSSDSIILTSSELNFQNLLTYSSKFSKFGIRKLLSKEFLLNPLTEVDNSRNGRRIYSNQFFLSRNIE